jgi:hypothetical protein
MSFLDPTNDQRPMTEDVWFGRSSFVLRPANKKPPPRIGTKDCFVVPPNFELELYIVNCKLTLCQFAICNLQFAIPLAACIGANRASILAQGRLGSGSEVVPPGSWPSTLAVGGALSLKAVAGLRILVNAASTLVRRIIARTIGRVKSAIRRIRD